MKNATIPKILCIFLLVSVSGGAFCQKDTTSLDDMSLSELLDVKIVSVSKETELLFDAPLSASVVTKEEIRKTGCTSIMEALRLVPGMIVREQSNGNYDIHLRGMDNVPPNTTFDVTSNTTTLVMIDNRPVYSYLKGGTFWETLPVDLNDVEKIEVIRGPAAALYGPNAVSGVINIITRQLAKEGLYVTANTRAGGLRTFINNASVGYKKGKLNMIASGNYQRRNRSQASYFEYYRNRELDNPGYMISFSGDTSSNIKERYPTPLLAMKKYAGNIFVGYDPTATVKIKISAGIQQSQVQKVSTENELTPLSEAESLSRYIDFSAKAGKLSAQASYNAGTQNTDYDPGNKYDFKTFDANMEYDYTIGKLSLKPGVSYRSAVYDDTKYSDIINKTGIFNARGTITTHAASLRGEYNLLDDKLRLVAGLSVSKFNYPDAAYTSRELAATYKVNKKNMFRAAYSRAPRSSNIFDTYVDQKVSYFPTGYRKFTQVMLVGNKDLQLLVADMFEVGYRGKINSRLTIDVEVFDIIARHFNVMVNKQAHKEINGTDTVMVVPMAATNIPLELRQQGITVSLAYRAKKLQINPFITIQKTISKNYPEFIDVTGIGPGPYDIYAAMGNKMTLKSTPVAFGGAQINYVLIPKLNINLSAYYYSSQTYHHFSNLFFNDGTRGIDHIPAKLILNAHLSYEPLKRLYVFCSGKNILNNKAREFFHTDEVPAMLLAGINYEF